MTQQGNPFLDDDPTDPAADGESGSSLRKWGKAEKARADQLAKDLAELQQKLAKREAADVFTRLGISDKVRKYYNGESTEEAITAWWKESAADFGVEPNAEQDVTVTEEQRQDFADLDQVSQLNGAGRERPDAMSREGMSEARKSLLSNRNATDADFDAALRKLNVPDLPLMAPQF